MRKTYKVTIYIYIYILTLLLMITSFQTVKVNAEGFPGTEQYLIRVDAEEAGGLPYYYAQEGNKKFVVYCFNSQLNWPGALGGSLLYTPDDFNQLDDETKDLIHRIFYAGYPHNNAGLYIESKTSLPTAEVVNEGLKLDTYLKNLFPGLVSVNLTYVGNGTGTIEQFDTDASKALQEAAEEVFYWEIEGDSESLNKLATVKENYREFYALVSAYFFACGVYSDMNTFLPLFDSMLPVAGMYVSKDEAHTATQIAIWQILKEHDVPNNNKNYDDYLTEGSLAKRLVDFAKDTSIPVPSRKYSYSYMESYKNSFNSGAHLLNSNNEVVGTDKIKFVKNPFDGKYYSEKLHFSQDAGTETYVSPFKISIVNGTNVLSTITTNGREEFVLVSDTMPTTAKVEIESENYWPSPIYQYAAKQNRESYQKMSGVWYEKVDLEFEVATYVEEGNLTIQKVIEPGHEFVASDKQFWFKGYFEIKDQNGNQIYGSLPYKRYKIDDHSTVLGNGVIKVFKKSDSSDYNSDFFIGANEEIVIEGLPVGTKYKIVEYGTRESNTNIELENWTPTYYLNGQIDVQQGTIVAGDNNTFKTLNDYKYDPIEVVLSGLKTLKDTNDVDKKFNEGDFSFVLYPDKLHYPMPANSKVDENTVYKVASNGAYDATNKNAKFEYGSIKFDTLGTYTYTIEELETDKEDVSIDPYHYHVVITISENSTQDGLVSSVSYVKHDYKHDPVGAADTSALFANTYNEHELDERIRANKHVINEIGSRDISREGYKFEITLKTIDGVAADTDNTSDLTGIGLTPVIITSGLNGEASTNVIKFTENWFTKADRNSDDEVILTAEIKEVIPEPKALGIVYDEQTATVSIKINKTVDADNSAKHHYKSHIEYAYKDKGGNDVTANNPAIFTNRYKFTGTVALNVEKVIESQLNYVKQVGETYEFEISDNYDRNGDKTGYVLPENRKVKLTYDGTNFVISNNEIKFLKEGDYAFDLKEVKGTKLGMAYDELSWFVAINVTDKENGTFEITPRYYHEHDEVLINSALDKATFTNKYSYKLDIPVTIKKSFIGKPFEEEAFGVKTYHSEGNVNPLTAPCHNHDKLTHGAVILNAQHQSVSTNTSVYGPGQYFVVYEEVEFEDKSIDFDKTKYIVELSVVQDGNTLKLDQGYPKYYKLEEGKTFDQKELIDSNIFEFVNKATSLKVSKEAVGFNANRNYIFNLTLTNADDTAYGDKLIRVSINGKHSTLTSDATGKVVFGIKSGETIVFDKLPIGTKYELTEVDSTDAKTNINIVDSIIKPFENTKTVSDELEAGVVERVLVKNINPNKPNKPKTPNNPESDRTTPPTEYKAPNTSVK